MFSVFSNARGGTGKTFLLNTLLAVVRTTVDTKQVALAVASSRIAATLQHKGRAFHSRFKAPLKPQKDTTLYVKPTATFAQLVKMTEVIIWDEALMIRRYHFEAFYSTLTGIK